MQVAQSTSLGHTKLSSIARGRMTCPESIVSIFILLTFLVRLDCTSELSIVPQLDFFRPLPEVSSILCLMKTNINVLLLMQTTTEYWHCINGYLKWPRALGQQCCHNYRSEMPCLWSWFLHLWVFHSVWYFNLLNFACECDLITSWFIWCSNTLNLS